MVNLLGFNILDCSKSEYIDNLMEQYKSGKKVIILSGNPEILYNASNLKEVKTLFSESDIIPDGIGVIAAGRIIKQPFKEKIAGIEVMEEILKQSEKNGMKVYMLGAEERVLKEAALECTIRYGALIKGYHSGYFSLENCQEIIDDINGSAADVLLVGMGCPRQELFIARYRHLLKCNIMMGVGGSFDVLAGKVKRAPRWMISIGMEWLYRVINEPARIVRLTSIPKFLFKVMLNRKNNG